MLESVHAAIAAVSATEWVAVVLAVGYLLLAIRQNAWCWAFSIASSALYLLLFWRAGLVMQSALQLFFIAMAAYGWRVWRGTESAEPAPVGRWPARSHLLALAAVAVVTVGNGAWIARAGTASFVPYADAAVACGSVLATWLVARKLIENWLYWIVIDLGGAALYWSQGLHATAGLFVLYSVLAWRGYRAWQRDAQSLVAANA